MYNITLCVDRIEENIVVAFSDDGTAFNFQKSDYNVSEGDKISATINDSGEIINVKSIPCDREKHEADLTKRLRKLFKNKE